MSFSTSNSDRRAATVALAALSALLAVYCVLLEAITRVGFDRVSRVQRRVVEDYRAAQTWPVGGPAAPPRVLVVGNSLLLKGVDRVLFKRTLQSKYTIVLLPVENTQFEDWFFGLRRLFAEGSRPAMVVVCLSTRQLISRGTAGEYFAHYLMRSRDVFAVKTSAGLDNTVTSNYFFANWSRWLGSRAEIRKWLASKLMPNLERLMAFFPDKTPAMPPPDKVVERALPHLQALSDLCRANGAALVVVVPPTLDKDDASREVAEAAARHGIRVLVPLRSDEVSPSDFSDGFHLNEKGAARFTQRLAAALLVLDRP